MAQGYINHVETDMDTHMDTKAFYRDYKLCAPLTDSCTDHSHGTLFLACH